MFQKFSGIKNIINKGGIKIRFQKKFVSEYGKVS